MRDCGKVEWRVGRDRTAAGLDGLRAFAVLAVFLFHYEQPHISGGLLGVQTFFVLSGG